MRKRKDFLGWHGIILLGVFCLTAFLLSKLFFFIPDSWGWMNEGAKPGVNSFFMPH